MVFLPVLRARKGFGFGGVNVGLVAWDGGTVRKEGRKERKRRKNAHRAEDQLGVGCDGVILTDNPS